MISRRIWYHHYNKEVDNLKKINKELYINNLKQLRCIFLQECQPKIRRIVSYVADFWLIALAI